MKPLCQDFPEALRSRATGSEPYVSKEELIKVVQWKLWIGAMRPSLLTYANEQNAAKVRRFSAVSSCSVFSVRVGVVVFVAEAQKSEIEKETERETHTQREREIEREGERARAHADTKTISAQ